MTHDRDVRRLLDAWFAEGPVQVADRVIDDAAARIARQPQRPAWRLYERPTMPAQFKLIAALAAILVVAAVGYSLLPGSSGPTGPTTAPTPPPSPTVTIAPTATATIATPPEGPLAAGTYRSRPFADSPMTLDVTVPGGGWSFGLPSSFAGPRGESNGPNGVVVTFLRAQTINSDPCHWDHDGSGSAPQEGDVEVGPTVDDLAAALAAGTTYVSTTPVDATLGGYSGKRVDLQLTPDPAGCDTWEGDVSQYFVFGGRDGAQFAQGDDNLWQITIVDVDGTRLIAVVISYGETSAADLSAAQAIVDSAVITP